MSGRGCQNIAHNSKVMESSFLSTLWCSIHSAFWTPSRLETLRLLMSYLIAQKTSWHASAHVPCLTYKAHSSDASLWVFVCTLWKASVYCDSHALVSMWNTLPLIYFVKHSQSSFHRLGTEFGFGQQGVMRVNLRKRLVRKAEHIFHNFETSFHRQPMYWDTCVT